jgi:hypothetical protein
VKVCSLHLDLYLRSSLFSKTTAFPIRILFIFFIPVCAVFVILAIALEPMSLGDLASILFLYGVLNIRYYLYGDAEGISRLARAKAR